MAESDVLCSGKDYLDKFDPYSFLQQYMGADVRGSRAHHTLRCHHDVFRTLPPNLTVLDYGSGPSILAAMSAATKASGIILSDYSGKNRNALHQWLNRDTAASAHDWSPHFRFVVKELEWKGEKEVEERQEQVRKLVKAVVYCDISQDPPIERDYDKLYDVVMSSLVIEAVAQTPDEYMVLMSRLGRLVKPGCLLLVYGVENNQSYMVGDFKFRDLPVTSELAMTAMKEAGSYDMSVDKFILNVLPQQTYTFMFIKGTRRV